MQVILLYIVHATVSIGIVIFDDELAVVLADIVSLVFPAYLRREHVHTLRTETDHWLWLYRSQVHLVLSPEGGVFRVHRHGPLAWSMNRSRSSGAPPHSASASQSPTLVSQWSWKCQRVLCRGLVGPRISTGLSKAPRPCSVCCCSFLISNSFSLLN